MNLLDKYVEIAHRIRELKLSNLTEWFVVAEDTIDRYGFYSPEFKYEILELPVGIDNELDQLVEESLSFLKDLQPKCPRPRNERV